LYEKIGLMFLMLVVGVAVGIRISGKLSPVEGKPNLEPDSQLFPERSVGRISAARTTW